MEHLNDRFHWLINPTTKRPLSTEDRSAEDIWKAGLELGYNMFGLAGEGAVTCWQGNWVALPGMIVGVMEGKETIITSDDGKTTTKIPPHTFDALVLGTQRLFNYRLKKWTIGEDSGCAVLVVRINHEEKRLELYHRDWIPTKLDLENLKKGRVYGIKSAQPLSVEDIVTMTSVHGVYDGKTGRRDFKIGYGRHKFTSGDDDGTTLLNYF